jgi:putative ABC transport system substrate-binding protein
MNRREFITLLGSSAAATWPLMARAQQSRTPVIGFLNATTPEGYARAFTAFRQGLNETGYDGRNVTIEYRSADDQYDRLAAMATDLVRRQVSVIAAAGTAAAVAAKAATTTIPTVFAIGRHPVEYGLVASLNRPGGNRTGVVSLNEELGPNRLQLLHELDPLATTFAALINPTSPNADLLSREMPAAARTLGLQLHLLYASTEHDFDTAFAILHRLQAGGLVICPDVFFIGRSQQLAALALRHKLPSVFQFRDFVEGGGLMSYGGSITDDYRLVGVYTGRILNGEKPADLPVQQATRIELIINMKTAKALGLTFPLTLLGRADEVIE